MKLIKLCYIAHGWHLALTGSELLDEVIFAWKYGPVIKTLYRDFKQYGNCQISELYRERDNQYPLPDDDIARFLDTIWTSYSNTMGLN